MWLQLILKLTIPIMTSITKTTSNVVSAAIVTAAMALPSLQFACADTAPERGIVSFKYLNYQESQGSLSQYSSSSSSSSSSSTSSSGKVHSENDNDNHAIWIDTISGATAVATSTATTPTVVTPKTLSTTTSSTAHDRISVNAYSVMALVPIAGVWSFGTTYISDSVSGASPTYHTSGLTTMHDARQSVDAQLTRYFSSGNVSAGTSYSKESDYLSRSYSLQGSLSTEDKNTTFTLGGSLTDDTINPSTMPNLNAKKTTHAGLIGITRVLTKNDIVQFNLGYSEGEGYYSDPYKYYDNRPGHRNNTTALARWNHHFEGTDGTVHLSYRYYSDTFGIRAHTLDTEYVQPLQNGWAVTPLLRLYTQNEADFYIATGAAEKADPTVITAPPLSATYYSEDQRLSAMGALTVGLKVSKQLNHDWLVDAKVEFYEQRSQWALSGKADTALAPFSARSIQLGISREF